MESDSRNSNQSSGTGAKTRAKSKEVRLGHGASSVPASEEVGSFLENIKLEWNLFWAGIAGDDDAASDAKIVDASRDPFEDGKLQILSIEQVKQITRALSQDRKKINQRMEQINREIELNAERIKSIELVGGDLNSTIEEINKLNDLGAKLHQQLEKVSGQLNRFRAREDELKGLR